MTVKIVTDSTADLPSNLVQEYDIRVVPLNVHFGEEVFRDGVEIWSDEFYHRVKNEMVFPNTSQPSPGEFLKVYRDIASTADSIISIHISRELSGTAGAAEIAAGMLENRSKVWVVDSRSVSMGLGLMVLKAARLAQNGASPETILEYIRAWQGETTVLFTVNSLEYLARTGRIGKATEFLGSLLNIKPLLGIKDGLIIPLERIRGNYQKVVSRMIELLQESYGSRPLLIGVLHTEMLEIKNYLIKEIEAALHANEIYPVIVSPVVGSHAGPSTFGIIAIPAE